MDRHRQAGATHARHGRTHDLHGGRHRLQVILREDALDSNYLGLVSLDDGVDRVGDRAQAKVRRQVLVRAGNADVDEVRPTRGVHVDDA